MWNGGNPPHQPIGMYTTTTPHESAAIVDDQLHMDAVSALTSLGVQASGFAPQPPNLTAQLVHTLSSNNTNNTTVPSYVPTTNVGTAAGVMSTSTMQHRYSEDFIPQPPQSSYFGGTPDDHVGNSLFNHPYHPGSMYGTTLNGGGGHPALQPVRPQYAQLVTSIRVPAVPIDMPSSRQGSSSSSAAAAIYHPLHPNDRPKVAMTNSAILNSGTSTSVPDMEYSDVHYPPIPIERGIKHTEEPQGEDGDDVEGDKMNNVNPVTATEEDEEDNATVEDENEGGNYELEVTAEVVEKIEPKPRGKPEAAARALAAAKLEESRMQDTLLCEDDDDDLEDEAKAPAIGPPKKVAARSNLKKSPAKKAAPNRKKSSISTNGTTSTPSTSVLASTAPLLSNPTGKREFLLGEDAPTITDAEYKNLQDMMVQFCRVPLLSEFSRPVAVLHPEVVPLYSKIVTHPVDLGHVCRGIRRRLYKNCRDVRLDVWRVFANCVKYNAHPSNKEAVPSFVSIALHLRDYFNNLWQEYLLPSDPPRKPKVLNNTNEDIAIFDVAKAAFSKRNEERTKRLENSGVLVLSKTFTIKASKLLLEFIEDGGRVDKLDKDPLFGNYGSNGKDVDLVIKRLEHYHGQLEELCESGSIEYTLDSFYKDLTKCYVENLDQDNLAMQNRFRCRLDRFFWKQAVPLHEANSRGVTQSSIWGNLAATIWARESSKKPFWPALCLGILPPAEQREGWHQAVTERNESRLPEKLRSQLMVAKKRCEQAQKRASLSYFLVEFLGTHEFIWVRETDIIENFDPNIDPNKTVAGKKSRSTSSVVGSKTYATAIQECVWASEEYENVLQDAFENATANENDDDDDEINFSFMTLAQSDDELDQGDEYGYQNDDDNMEWSDVSESNYLISHDGMFDASMAGRKSSKKRSQLLKKQTNKKGSKDVAMINKDDPAKKKRSRPNAHSTEGGSKTANANDDGRAVKNDMKDLERRRKKRLRDHEKSGKPDARKKTSKRRRTTSNDLDELDQRLVHDKQCRATAIVKAYLMRLAKQSDNKSLALSGVLTMPSASVDSIGLLGMTLAFRAASGGLCMPDDGKEQLAKWKPWVVVDTERPKTAVERVQNLNNKIELIENEISRLRNDTKRRSELTALYTSKRLASEQAAATDDVAARFNHYKKRKKFTPSKSDNMSDSESPVGKMPISSTQEQSIINTAECKEDTSYETDNESDLNGSQEVIVDERDQSTVYLDAATGEYDSSEEMDAADSE